MVFANMSPEDKHTLVQHLEDLRKSILISVIAVLATTLVSFSFNEKLMEVVMYPVSGFEQRMIVTGITEAFFVKLKLSFLSGFILAFPIILWALWRFFKPALYPRERKYVYLFLPFSLLLFVVGLLFAYFVVLKVVLGFFIFMAGDSLEPLFKVDQYMSFVIGFILPFGLIFQMPVASFLLAKLGIIKYEALVKNRKYAILIFFVVAAILTPPDPLSQIMLAIPMMFLFEISLFTAKYASRKAITQELV